MKIIIFLVFLAGVQSEKDNLVSKLLSGLLGSDNVLKALENNLLSIGKTNFIQKNVQNPKLSQNRIKKEDLMKDTLGGLLVTAANTAPLKNLTSSLTTILSGVLDNNVIRSLNKGLYKGFKGINLAGGVGTTLIYELYETALRNRNDELANLLKVVLEILGTKPRLTSYTISDKSYNLFLDSYQRDLLMDTPEYQDLTGKYGVPQSILVDSNNYFSTDMSVQRSEIPSSERCSNPELSSRSDDLINLLESSMSSYAQASGPLGEQVMMALQAKEILMVISCIEKTRF